MKRESYKVVVARSITMYISCVLVTATSSGQRCPSRHVGNWKRCTRHLSSCRCPRYHRLPVTRPRLIDSRFFTRTHPLSSSSLSVLRLASISLSPRLRRPCFLYRRFAYTRRHRSLTNLIYEPRRPAKDLSDESIRSEPLQQDRGLFIVTTCNELYSPTLSALHLNGYKLIVLRLSFDGFFL